MKMKTTMKKLINTIKTELSSVRTWKLIGFLFIVAMLAILAIAGMFVFFYVIYWIFR